MLLVEGHKKFVTEPGTETTSSQSQSSFFNHKMISKRPGSETGLQHKNSCNSEGAPSTSPAGQSCLGCGQWAGCAITVSRVTEQQWTSTRKLVSLPLPPCSTPTVMVPIPYPSASLSPHLPETPETISPASDIKQITANACQYGRSSFLNCHSCSASLPQNKGSDRSTPDFPTNQQSLQLNKILRGHGNSYCLKGRINFLYNILDKYLFNAFLRTSSSGD